MDKFIKFNDGIFNTRHIVALVKTEKDTNPKYGIELHFIHDIERQYFKNDFDRDREFTLLSQELLNDLNDCKIY